MRHLRLHLALHLAACGAAVARLRARRAPEAGAAPGSQLDGHHLKVTLAPGGRPQLDLGSLSLVHSSSSAVENAEQGWGMQLVHADLPDGREAACLNCDPDFFKDWVTFTLLGAASVAPAQAAGSKEVDNHTFSHGKHPNAPGYDAWEAEQRRTQGGGASLLAHSAPAGTRGAAAAASLPPARPTVALAAAEANVTIRHLLGLEVQAMLPRLNELWAERRLVVGPGADPLRQRMDFVEALSYLARGSPSPECVRSTAANCGPALSAGLRPEPSFGQLWSALARNFGPRFLEKHQHDPLHSPAEQRRHVEELLLALKHGYVFYKQRCLVHSPGSKGCDRMGPSTFLGRVACNPEDDGPLSGCVYAEVRRCGGDSGPGDTCAIGLHHGFFEYSRLHGPVALFDTRLRRNHVMGQCEEFSRAALALLTALGYEARYVLDFTDHVWVEVRLPPLASNGTGKPVPLWVHADPSEGVLDAPYMYETGWGKQLTMIFAMTPSGVQHVTSSYTHDYEATVLRRGIPEEELQSVVDEVNQRLAFELPKNKWGFSSVGKLSKDRSLAELALWSHFEAA